jgi:hypothetical protein
MAKELEERKQIKKKLKKKEDYVRYDFSDMLLVQLRRCTADLNRLARIDRIIEKEQFLYSVISNREAGYIDVVRNY